MNELWRDSELVNPHAAVDKAARVRGMFAAIAPSYDLNNRVHSMWRDQAWRRAAVKMAQVRHGDVVVDVACGTGDLSLEFLHLDLDLTQTVVGVDFTYEMLGVAKSKARAATLDDYLTLIQADAMRLPLPDASCDVVSIAFGLRNVEDAGQAIAEFHRVLRPGGRLIVLEFSTPTNPMLRWLHHLYCGQIMPRTASWIARDTTGAYRYLPRSVSTFLSREAMVEAIGEAGFSDITAKPLTFGIAVCYRGLKRG